MHVPLGVPLYPPPGSSFGVSLAAPRAPLSGGGGGGHSSRRGHGNSSNSKRGAAAAAARAARARLRALAAANASSSHAASGAAGSTVNGVLPSGAAGGGPGSGPGPGAATAGPPLLLGGGGIRTSSRQTNIGGGTKLLIPTPRSTRATAAALRLQQHNSSSDARMLFYQRGRVESSFSRGYDATTTALRGLYTGVGGGQQFLRGLNGGVLAAGGGADGDTTTPTTPCRAGQVLLDALTRLQKKDKKMLFANAVDKALVPDYYIVVKEPMYMEKIKQKIRAREYTTFEAFDADVELIISNCRLYNQPDTPYCRVAASVETCWTKFRERVRAKFAAAAAQDAEDAAAAAARSREAGGGGATGAAADGFAAGAAGIGRTSSWLQERHTGAAAGPSGALISQSGIYNTAAGIKGSSTTSASDGATAATFLSSGTSTSERGGPRTGADVVHAAGGLTAVAGKTLGSGADAETGAAASHLSVRTFHHNVGSGGGDAGAGHALPSTAGKHEGEGAPYLRKKDRELLLLLLRMCRDPAAAAQLAQQQQEQENDSAVASSELKTSATSSSFITTTGCQTAEGKASVQEGGATGGLADKLAFWKRDVSLLRKKDPFYWAPYIVPDLPWAVSPSWPQVLGFTDYSAAAAAPCLFPLSSSPSSAPSSTTVPASTAAAAKRGASSGAAALATTGGRKQQPQQQQGPALYHRSVKAFLGERTLKKLDALFPELRKELESVEQVEAPRLPLNDLRIFGVDTADFPDYNTKLSVANNFLLGVGEGHLQAASTLATSAPPSAFSPVPSVPSQPGVSEAGRDSTRDAGSREGRNSNSNRRLFSAGGENTSGTAESAESVSSRGGGASKSHSCGGRTTIPGSAGNNSNSSSGLNISSLQGLLQKHLHQRNPRQYPPLTVPSWLLQGENGGVAVLPSWVQTITPTGTSPISAAAAAVSEQSSSPATLYTTEMQQPAASTLSALAETATATGGDVLHSQGEARKTQHFTTAAGAAGSSQQQMSSEKMTTAGVCEDGAVASDLVPAATGKADGLLAAASPEQAGGDASADNHIEQQQGSAAAGNFHRSGKNVFRPSLGSPLESAVAKHFDLLVQQLVKKASEQQQQQKQKQQETQQAQQQRAAAKSSPQQQQQQQEEIVHLQQQQQLDRKKVEEDMNKQQHHKEGAKETSMQQQDKPQTNRKRGFEVLCGGAQVVQQQQQQGAIEEQQSTPQQHTTPLKHQKVSSQHKHGLAANFARAVSAQQKQQQQHQRHDIIERNSKSDTHQEAKQHQSPTQKQNTPTQQVFQQEQSVSKNSPQLLQQNSPRVLLQQLENQTAQQPHQEDRLYQQHVPKLQQQRHLLHPEQNSLQQHTQSPQQPHAQNRHPSSWRQPQQQETQQQQQQHDSQQQQHDSQQQQQQERQQQQREGWQPQQEAGQQQEGDQHQQEERQQQQEVLQNQIRQQQQLCQGMEREQQATQQQHHQQQQQETSVDMRQVQQQQRCILPQQQNTPVQQWQPLPQPVPSVQQHIQYHIQQHTDTFFHTSSDPQEQQLVSAPLEALKPRQTLQSKSQNVGGHLETVVTKAGDQMQHGRNRHTLAARQECHSPLPKQLLCDSAVKGSSHLVRVTSSSVDSTPQQQQFELLQDGNTRQQPETRGTALPHAQHQRTLPLQPQHHRPHSYMKQQGTQQSALSQLSQAAPVK